MAYFLRLGLEQQLAVQQTVQPCLTARSDFCLYCEKYLSSSISKQLKLSMLKAVLHKRRHTCTKAFPDPLVLTAPQPWRNPWWQRLSESVIQSAALTKIFLPLGAVRLQFDAFWKPLSVFCRLYPTTGTSRSITPRWVHSLGGSSQHVGPDEQGSERMRL